MAKTPAKSEDDSNVLSDKPDWLKEMEAQGASSQDDNFGAEDVIVPQIKLLQGISSECEQFDDAKAGRFWHTGFDLSLGHEFNFIVASRCKKYLLLAPISDGQGVLARADDAQTWDRLGNFEVKLQDGRTVTWNIDRQSVAESGLDQWGTSDPNDPDSPPAATLVYEYLVLLPDCPEYGAAVLSLARSQIRKARKGLNDKIQLHRQAGRPMQSIVFQARSVDDSNPNNQTFKNVAFTQNGFASKELYNSAVEMSTLLQSYTVAGEEENLNESRRATEPEDGSDPEY